MLRDVYEAHRKTRETINQEDILEGDVIYQEGGTLSLDDTLPPVLVAHGSSLKDRIRERTAQDVYETQVEEADEVEEVKAVKDAKGSKHTFSMHERIEARAHDIYDTQGEDLSTAGEKRTTELEANNQAPLVITRNY